MNLSKEERAEFLQLCAEKYTAEVLQWAPKPLISPEATAALLGISLSALQKEKIDRVNLLGHGKKIFYRAEDIEAFISSKLETTSEA